MGHELSLTTATSKRICPDTSIGEPQIKRFQHDHRFPDDYRAQHALFGGQRHAQLHQHTSLIQTPITGGQTHSPSSSWLSTVCQAGGYQRSTTTIVDAVASNASRETSFIPYGQATDIQVTQIQHEISVQGIAGETREAKLELCVEQSLKDVLDVVCFGMLVGLHGWIPVSPQPHRSARLPADIISCSSFRLHQPVPQVGSFSRAARAVLEGLCQEENLDLDAECLMRPSNSQGSARCSKRLQTLECSMNIVLYGPRELCDGLGEYLEQHGHYLQRPKRCRRNVPYVNPHTLAALAGPMHMTFDLEDCDCAIEAQVVTNESDILDDFKTTEVLAEAPQPSAVRTLLKTHQREALTFLLRRERGWHTDYSVPDIWGVKDSNGQSFINRINDAEYSTEPSDFRGGIIADPMGLGKTLTMIALIANDLDDDIHRQHGKRITLVIVPPALIAAWEEQLEEHLWPGSVDIYRHHGRYRFSEDMCSTKPAIVITTYQTVAMECKRIDSDSSSTLFRTTWWRIILDEAHSIRNVQSQTSKAVCSLEARARWAVTGTPLQNRLSDLSTLLKFIRADPYHKVAAFESDIVALWKRGAPDEALDRLKKLMQCLVLRRPKSTLELPGRIDLRQPLDFTNEERHLYESIRQDAAERVKEVILQTGATKSGYLNALQQIDALRRLCNLGCHFKSTNKFGGQDTRTGDWQSAAQSSFDILLEFGDVTCHSCGSTIDMTTEQLVQEQHNASILIFACLRVICSLCVHKSNAYSGKQCGCTPFCQSSMIKALPQSRRDAVSGRLKALYQEPPTKVKALITQLQKLEAGVKSLVFTFWATTLDLIEPALEEANFKFVRFDGKTSQKKREEVLANFRKDPTINVMLITLSCGAAGLNLTAASRVFLMEPHWNPTVEEQALARVHRIGQTREVTTMRLYIRDSFEEHVMQGQVLKRELAELVLAKPGSQANSHKQRLELLRRLL